MTDQLKWVATVGPKGLIGGSRVIAEDEHIDLKGGEQFVTFTKSEAQKILGHPITIGADGRPDFSENDIQVISEHRNMEKRFAGMTPRNRRRLLRKLNAELDAKQRPLVERKDFIDRAIAALEELQGWAAIPMVLEKPSGSRFHKFIEAASNGDLIILTGAVRKEIKPKVESVHTANVWKDATVFVVEHDWASVFSKATDYISGEYRLPDDQCAFEFKVSGYHLIILTAKTDPQSDEIQMFPAVQLKSGDFALIPWAYTQDGNAVNNELKPYEDQADCNKIFNYANVILSQIRAVAIALDANVAQKSVVSADRKLNQARERRGHLPIYDYHVVSLANRSRARPVPVEPGEVAGARKALHFVRGHRRNIDASIDEAQSCVHQWTPYDTDGRSNCPACHARSRWINWHLRGDPDLGFIDKHYRL